MRVRVAYTIDVSDDYRRAINLYYGKLGLASREDVQRWARSFGSAGDDDLMRDLQQAEADETQD
jgi:hypothetical protein